MPSLVNQAGQLWERWLAERWHGPIGPADQRRIKEFAADLWEASVAAPLI